MSATTRYVSENHNRLINEFCECSFEHPASSSFFSNGEKIRFSGWLIPKKNHEISIVIKKSGALHKTHQCTIARPDVVKAKNLSDAYLMSGFSFEIQCDSSYEIFFRYEQKELLVWDIKHYLDDFDSTSTSSKLKKSWLGIHETSAPIETSYTTEELNEFFSQLPVLDKVSQLDRRAEELKSIKNFDIESFKSFATLISNPFWSIEIIEQSLINGMLSIPSPFNKEKATCYQSIAINDFNFLIFYSENNFFYLVQHCTTICIILPQLLCIFSLSDSNWVREAQKRLTKAYTFLSSHPSKNPSNNTVQPRFLGVLVAQSRPYHYFYDYLYGMQFLESQGASLKDLNLYSINGYNFYNLQELFEQKTSALTKTEAELNEITYNQNGFLLAPCVQYSTTHDNEIIKKLDERLVKHATQKHINIIKTPDNHPNKTLTIWIGISSEKRSWIEQVEGFSKIIDTLKVDHPDLCIIVDGRTFSSPPTDADFANKKIEDQSFEQLRKSNPDVRFINAIGCFSSEKIYLASLCNLFITSYSTDSMYPSRICGKPGVVYAPHCMTHGARDLHIHHNITEIPKEHIKDIQTGPGSQVWHTISYSIDWHIILEAIEKLIKSLSFKRNDT